MRTLAATLLAFVSPMLAAGEFLDLTRAVVVAPPNANATEQTAVTILVEEVEKRAQVRWPVSTAVPAGGMPVVAISRAAGSGPHPAEGYQLRVSGTSVAVTGNDPRGVLFGAGRLLRSLRMERGAVRIPSGLALSSAPAYRIRGHQIGNRPLNNAADAWTVPMWEQYIRDLAVFGANAVELIPPYAFRGEDSPHFVLPPLTMMAEVSRILDRYGMDVWLWYPALEKDYADPRTVDAAVSDCAAVFRAMPRIDAVFVPGGDPGHTHPRHLMPYLEKLSAALRAAHPRAGVWVSPQGFDEDWLAAFLAALQPQPAWLAGVVYGPGVRISMAELRSRVPARYPIRIYPDITHTVRSQYPIPDWDVAWALVYDREPINPLPLRQAALFREAIAHSAGFITYSDGVNDDVNKFVWSALGWDPQSPVDAVLGEYGRYFIGEELGHPFFRGLLALERNWKGSLLANEEVPLTLLQFQAMERAASPRVLANWRFQQGLYRAHYDAYTRQRLLREAALEARAREHLDAARTTGSALAMQRAEAVLEETVTHPQFQNLRARLFELGAALYQSIGMQLGFDLYRASSRRRAASLETVDTPLNDRPWLLQQFAAIRRMADESQRLAGIDALVNWKNPGPGGFYDDLGDPNAQPHLVREPGAPGPSVNLMPDAPLAWSSYANSGRGAPIRMRYDGLDPEARYRVRVVYAGENVSQEQGIRLLADGNIEVHPYIKKPLPVRPVEFDVPVEATRDGQLELAWDREITPSGRIRGAQVAEVWLMRK